MLRNGHHRHTVGHGRAAGDEGDAGSGRKAEDERHEGAEGEKERERGGGGREGGSYSLLIDPLSYPVSWSRQSHLNLHELMADSDPFYTPEFSTGA